MKIIITNASDDPIYEQIARQLKSHILAEELREGEPLPSIRGLAKELQISVITTKRAYEELEHEGFIDTVPGKGSYVAMQNKDLLREKKMKMVEDKLAEAVLEARMLDVGYEQLLEMLKILCEEEA